MPEVTVFIPTYNRAHFLPDAVDSILRQTFADFELLIIDDGSTDDTLNVLERYRDRRLRVISNPGNLGSPKTRNRGLDLAEGRFIAMLDSDDAAHPDRLRRQVDFLKNHLDHALIGSGKKRLGGGFRLGTLMRRRPTTADAVRTRLLFRCCIAHPTVMGQTEILKRFRYDETFSVSQDYELFVRLADHYKLANLREPLVQVRRHAGQESHKREQVGDRLKVVLKRQLEALGIEFGADDLDRHFLLSRPRGWHRPTREDLEWAEAWLARIKTANRQRGRYEEAALERIIGEVWFELCIKAMPGAARDLRRWLWRSPLASSAWSGVKRRTRPGINPALSP